MVSVSVGALLVVFALAAPLQAQTSAPPARASTVDRGIINGAPYYIENPASWNKGLVL